MLHLDEKGCIRGFEGVPDYRRNKHSRNSTKLGLPLFIVDITCQNRTWFERILTCHSNLKNIMLISFLHRWLTAPTEKLFSSINLSGISPGRIARVTGVSWPWLQNYVNDKLVAVPRQVKVC